MAELADRGVIWGSVLSVNAFAAIRSVGFEPVGQVFGAAVYPLTATAAASCPGTTAHYLVRDATPRVTGVPDAGARIAQALYDGYRAAIDRMTGECSDLGGHGVVGAALHVTEALDTERQTPTARFIARPGRLAAVIA
jgi:hypothetical protein